MLRAMAILVVKIVPQETWLYFTFKVVDQQKTLINLDVTGDGHSCGKNRPARNMALLHF
ncbi:hypothetical protein ACLUXD_05975 [Loigolactobacillus coryniformis subsp. coryniformis]